MKTPIKKHLYQGDGIPDHRGDDRCEVCKLPKRTCPNTLPETSADVREAEARRMGETTE